MSTTTETTVVEAVFAESKETPGTWQFKEVVGPVDEPALKTIYVPKRTLKGLGWQPGTQIRVTVELI